MSGNRTSQVLELYMDDFRVNQRLRSAGQKSQLVGITMTNANLVIRQGEHRTPVLEGLQGGLQRRSDYEDSQKHFEGA
jgi:hypothetical protein